jgi:hypothetical protein
MSAVKDVSRLLPIPPARDHGDLESGFGGQARLRAEAPSGKVSMTLLALCPLM